ncbi:glycosyltransferase [Candidatus Marinimicrobia bacterium]|nr:glycosyltransferase [Candidatus Neomarinimicrobiota bacterium]
MKEQVFISIVVYAYNEEISIKKFLENILSFLENKFEHYELLIVNDSSTDSTKSIVKEFLKDKEHNNITMINLSKRHGLETAILVGVDYAIGDYVIEIDSPSMPYKIEYLNELYIKSSEGFDIVSLKLNKNLKITSTIFYKILNKFSKIKVDDKSEIGFILSRRAINAISRVKDKIKYRKIIHNFSGFNKTSISVDIDPSKIKSLNSSERIEMASDILFSYSDIGFKISYYIAVTFMIISLALGVYTVINYFFNQDLVTGWTTMMMFMSIGFSGIFFVFSNLSKILSLMNKEIRTLPNYVIDSIEKY